MVNTSLGGISPDGSSTGVHSKYLLTFALTNGAELVFEVTTSVAVSTLTSADDALTLTWTNVDDVTGFRRFNGTIGAGKLNITLPNNVTIIGAITGGPVKVQTFSGSGTWSTS